MHLGQANRVETTFVHPGEAHAPGSGAIVHVVDAMSIVLYAGDGGSLECGLRSKICQLPS